MTGRREFSPLIFRRSCSSFRLWITLPEQRNSIALKKACVHMWNRANRGCPIPIEVTISPSCLVVEYATIFLMSCWTIAVEAANKAVIPPRRSIIVCLFGVFENRLSVRINKNTPATTIVDLWSRADTGVGPSMAAGSHG